LYLLAYILNEKLFLVNNRKTITGDFKLNSVIKLLNLYDSLTHIRTLLRKAPDKDITGGRIYDVVIGACVFRAKASVLLTFNEAHFLPFVERGMEVVVPGKGRL